MGVAKLIVGNIKIKEDKMFQQLSVTADKHIPIEEVTVNDLPFFLGKMKKEGYTLIGLEQTSNSKSITEYKFPEDICLVLGTEKTGIPLSILRLLDVCIEIPQFGLIRSLNVHVSGSLILWEIKRQQLQSIKDFRE